ncbi:MAG: hypothetical protein Q9169_005856 [Polycauliona sp. 2 TL-2023]
MFLEAAEKQFPAQGPPPTFTFAAGKNPNIEQQQQVLLAAQSKQRPLNRRESHNAHLTMRSWKGHEGDLKFETMKNPRYGKTYIIQWDHDAENRHHVKMWFPKTRAAAKNPIAFAPEFSSILYTAQTAPDLVPLYERVDSMTDPKTGKTDNGACPQAESHAGKGTSKNDHADLQSQEVPLKLRSEILFEARARKAHPKAAKPPPYTFPIDPNDLKTRTKVLMADPKTGRKAGGRSGKSDGHLLVRVWQPGVGFHILQIDREVAITSPKAGSEPSHNSYTGSFNDSGQQVGTKRCLVGPLANEVGPKDVAPSTSLKTAVAPTSTAAIATTSFASARPENVAESKAKVRSRNFLLSSL